MRTIRGGNFSHAYHDREKYGVRIEGGLLVIDTDTTFVESNFMQAAPHTEVFSLAPGVQLVLEACNLINVTVPDKSPDAPETFGKHVKIHGGNLAHVVPTETGNPERPVINLLHDCDKCASARRVLVDRIAAGTVAKDESGRIRHDLLKDAFRARRQAHAAADIAWQEDGNDEALARWAP